MHRICLCPASIAWIRRHLKKSAKATFTRLISKGSISKITRHRKKSRRRGKKKAWMIKGSKAAKAHMRKVRNARR